jgi:hypothetical protein
MMLLKGTLNLRRLASRSSKWIEGWMEWNNNKVLLKESGVFCIVMHGA